MSAIDATFYYMEEENTPMHVGGVAVLEGPPPAYGDLIRLMLSKLDKVPRYRQVVRPLPLHIGRPVWVDDPHFQILYHVRHTALPSPGGEEQLRNLAGRIFAQRLDMSKPVWECWLVEGLEGGRWAVISKAHHCMIDGVAGTDLMQVLFDLEPVSEVPDAPDWQPRPQASSVAMVADSVTDAVAEPFRRMGIPALSRLGKVPQALRGAGKAVEELLPSVLPHRSRPMPGGLNGPLGPHRRWAWTDASLADVKLIRSALGGTINDVVLTGVTRGYRDLLLGRGELAPGQVVRSLVPVSIRSQTGRGQLNNQVTAVFVDLPVSEEDPVRRLQLIRDQMDRNKRALAAVDAAAIAGLADFAAPTLLALGSRAMSRIPHNLTQTGTTNVPGPRVPLYMLGHRLVESHPYVPLFFHVRVAVGIFSYLDRFSFGITADFDAIPDVEVLANGIHAGFAELRDVAASREVAQTEVAAKPVRRTPGSRTGSRAATTRHTAGRKSR